MIYYFIFITYFVNVVLSLQCKTASPPNCIYNSTCVYNITQCSISSAPSTERGGTYCATVITKTDEIVVGKMDCMYDQETTKKCKNQTECNMKYTNQKKTFLHCCCDQDFCNLNFTLSDPDPPIANYPVEDTCKNLLCKPMYIIISCITIGLIIVITFISIVCRKKSLKSFEQCKKYISKSPTTKTSDTLEKGPLLISINEEQVDKKIDYNLLKIGDIVKRGRFSTIHEGLYDNNRVAIKILTYLNQTDESYILFHHEKQIYSLPFMDHINILKYFGYSKYNDQLCIITELSENGSLRDVLRSRLLNDENELLLILRQISEGLQYLHNEYRNDNGLIIRPSIAHRDLKSDNILYLNSNRLVICDFAMSTKIEQNQNSPNQEQQIGTPRYMSPEILAGTIGCEKEALLKCDVYALGIIIWEILSRYPFQDCDVKYVQPFEKQLIENNFNVYNPNVNDMSRIMMLSYPLNRPLINPLWKNSNKSWLNLILKTMEDCWDQTPEARITSAAVANRLQKIIL